MFVDTHAHLHYWELRNQLDNVIQRAADVDVEMIICVGTDLDSSKASIAIAERYAGVFAAVGVHPHDADKAPVDYLKEIERLAEHPKVVALGEMGLDFYRNLSARDTQIEVFGSQLQLARDLNLPAVVHNRDANGDICEILVSVGHRKGVMHCFSSAVNMAERVLDLGFHVSFTGMITFPPARSSGGRAGAKNHTASVLKEIPLGSIMLETDCPYLAPVPQRGKLNEPANIPYIAAKMAQIKGESLETVAKVTTLTARQLFALPK